MISCLGPAFNSQRLPRRSESINLLVTCLSAELSGHRLFSLQWSVASVVTALTEAATTFKPNRRRIADADASHWLRIVADGYEEYDPGELDSCVQEWTDECSQEAKKLLDLLSSDSEGADQEATIRLQDLTRDVAERSRKRSEAILSATDPTS
jgi:hypothetical protein